MKGSRPETKQLRRDVESALRQALDPATVLPLLHRLSRAAAEGTDESLYAHRQLAELLADQHPWRAALHAKRILAVHPTDDRAWATLALCQVLLGHYRFAARAYRRALEVTPGNAAYAHNLGHLTDVALGRPKEALPWLRAAYDGTEQRGDVAVSFAHALGRAGELEEAKRVAGDALRGPDLRHAREHVALLRWLEHGAPAEQTLLPARPPARGLWNDVNTAGKRVRRRSRSEARQPAAEGLEATLARGLVHLPLDASQKERATALARDAALRSELAGGPALLTALAAAIAYAVVYVDHMPHTQAEVAAPFRVSVPALRGRFKALRSWVDLTPGDTEYATTRHPR